MPSRPCWTDAVASGDTCAGIDQPLAHPATGPLRIIPNTISAFRILGVPLWIVLLSRCDAVAAGGGDVGAWRWATVLMLLAIGASDLVDGYIARRYRVASRRGAILDAFADGLVQLGGLGFFALVAHAAFPPVPVWYFTLMAVRGVVLAGGWLAMGALDERAPVVHEWHGKLSAFLMFLLLVWVTSGLPESGVRVGTIAIAAFVGWSTTIYVRVGWRAHRAARQVG